MVTARYLTNKWVKPLQEKFREQGRQEGREWNRRRLEAQERGIPFNEPFPGDDEVDADN